MTGRPSWLRVAAPNATAEGEMRRMRELLGRHRLTTVCQGARCPNAVECWSARTATFMLLGEICTRACRFCGVPTGDPGGVIDDDEPARVAAAVAELGLRYAVLTSVDRDDLPDGGAAIFAEAVERVRLASPSVRIEVLVPDFSGRATSLDRIASSGAHVVGHNVETIERLSGGLRDRRAGYRRSLAVLGYLREAGRDRIVKSGFMVGLGETREEIGALLQDLRGVGVDAVTVGQYLRPARCAVPVARYVAPHEFDEIAAEGRALGFSSVLAGPFVRSSYHAGEADARRCGS